MNWFNKVSKVFYECFKSKMSFRVKKKSCFSGHATGWILDLADGVLTFLKN
jgi:hypothetical protein